MTNLMFQKMAALTLLFASFSVQAALVKSDVEYKVGSQTMQGYLVYDDANKGKLPGVLVVHDWLGVTEKTKERADMLAGLGYVAFAADVFGKGKRGTDNKSGSELSTPYKEDRKKFREHLKAAMKEFKKQKMLDTAKVAAVGYCFGGAGVMELARTGEKLKGVVSFHGGLDSPSPKDGKNIKAPVLALHGADDPFVKDEDLKAWVDEMRTHKIDWQLVKYGNAVHSFTDKTAGTDNSKGQAYNALADARSWEAMKDFLAGVFK